MAPIDLLDTGLVATNLQLVKMWYPQSAIKWNSTKWGMPVFACLCFMFILFLFPPCFFSFPSKISHYLSLLLPLRRLPYLSQPKLIPPIALESYLAHYFIIYVFIYLISLDVVLLEGRSSLCLSRYLIKCFFKSMCSL